MRSPTTRNRPSSIVSSLSWPHFKRLQKNFNLRRSITLFCEEFSYRKLNVEYYAFSSDMFMKMSCPCKAKRNKQQNVTNIEIKEIKISDNDHQYYFRIVICQKR